MSDADSPSEDSGNKDEHDNYEELTGAVDTININDESSENENQMDDGSSENENQMDDGSDLPESPEATESRNNNSLKKALDELVQYFKEKKMLPDIVAELIQMKKLNTMILDLYDYDKGYEISFQKYEDDFEIFHGQYSYGVSLIEYIRDGEIPYEIFDKIYNYEYKLFYDGYVLCRLRIHFEQEDSMRSHFVLLRHTIQTINGECAMNCEADSSLDFETEKARLIYHYSPDLCLDPSPVVAEIIINNELNQHPFITPYLKHIIQNEKARREKGIREMCKKSASYSEPAPTKPKDDDWNFRSKEPSKEEEELSKMGSKAGRNPSILSYLKERRICYPDKDSYTGLHTCECNYQVRAEIEP
ncbi:unnamed protein product [Larinioides sclopetarius]|uniref:Uncharacterized protein n=1 Tax=Larinioides sclopetarius TaxID=280406 RepID=A0AAV2BCN3_9ARAC